jgi:hypothetical protein
VGFMVDRVALGCTSLRVLRFYPAIYHSSITPCSSIIALIIWGCIRRSTEGLCVTSPQALLEKFPFTVRNIPGNLEHSSCSFQNEPPPPLFSGITSLLSRCLRQSESSRRSEVRCVWRVWELISGFFSEGNS